MRESLVVFKTEFPGPNSTLASQIAYLNAIKAELDSFPEYKDKQAALRAKADFEINIPSACKKVRNFFMTEMS